MTNTLSAVEQKTVTLYDEELVAVRGEDEKIYVAVRHMCNALGIDQRSQRRRIQNHSIISEGYVRGDILTPPGKRGGGGRQQTGLLRVDLVPLWLAGIETGKVSEEKREKLESFQREAATVLWEAFQQGRLTATPSFDQLIQKDSPAVNAYKMAVAVVELARNQVLLEARIDEHEGRLEQIEATLGDPGRQVSQDQASQISQAVKTVALVLSKSSGSNQYGSVYGELYRKFGVTSYKLLPERKFDEAMQWLTEWHEQLTNDNPF